ncbi:MAG: hypothetical protein ABI369_12565 [Acetobacteraceae bacterium]
MADPEDVLARRFTDDPALLAAAEKQAREQGWHQGLNQTVLGIGPVPWWLRKPATAEEITAFLAELDAEDPDSLKEGPPESPST